MQVFFRDGAHTERVQVDFPIGHRKRRAEGMPVLVKKFEASVDAHFPPKQAERIKALFAKTGGARCPAGERVRRRDGDERGGLRAAGSHPTRTGTKMRVSPRWIRSAMCPLEFSTALLSAAALASGAPFADSTMSPG